MPLTQQQRKALWICGGLYLASYPVRWAMDYSRQAAYYQQQAIRAAQQRAYAKAHPPAPPACSRCRPCQRRDRRHSCRRSCTGAHTHSAGNAPRHLAR
jgi:hypothetical protein